MIKTVNNATPSEHVRSMGLDPDFLPPFALRENEQAIPVIFERENHKLTSRYEAEFLVSVGVISEDVDIKLLEIINKFIVINVRQLLSVAMLDGIEITREKVMSSIKNC